MQEVRLYLNDNLVDLETSTKIVETKQINSLFELVDRQTSYTNTFKILLTKDTNKFLGDLSNKYNLSNAPYSVFTPKLYRNGLNTIANGKFVIKSVSNGVVTGGIQSGLVSLYDAFGSKKLSDLDFSDINHVFNETNIINSYTNTYLNGYTYPIANYGNVDVNALDFDYQLPSIYLKYLFDKIMAESGFVYNYVGDTDPLDSESFKTKAISLNQGVLTNPTNVDVTTLKAVASGVFTVVGKNRINTNETEDPKDLHTLDTIGNSRITIKQTGYYTIAIKGYLQRGYVRGYKNNTKIIDAIYN
jgi:hypothetical protein